MNAAAISQLVRTTKPPLNFYTSDGRTVYVDHPESVLIRPQVIVIAPGANGAGRMLKEIISLSPDHIVRIEPAKRKLLRRVA